jgi:hypothetical protein
MNKVLLLVIILIAIIVTAGLVIVFVVIGNLGSMGTYEEDFTFYYTPALPSSVEDVRLNTDVTDIIVKYNTTPTNYYAKAEMHFSLVGIDVEGKTYTDFFEPIIWQNTTSPLTFTLETIPDIWISFPVSIQNRLTVTLRTDVTYKLTATSATGEIQVTIPNQVSVDDIDITSSTGEISLNANEVAFTKGFSTESSTGSHTIGLTNCAIGGDFAIVASTGSTSLNAIGVTFGNGLSSITSTGRNVVDLTDCVIEGDVTIETTTGSKEFNANDITYNGYSTWDIFGSTGDCVINIDQNSDLGAEVTGKIESSTGAVVITYTDTNSNVGATFAASTTTGSISFTSTSGGFAESGDTFTSNDYPTTNNYDLELISTTGMITVDASST